MIAVVFLCFAAFAAAQDAKPSDLSTEPKTGFTPVEAGHAFDDASSFDSAMPSRFSVRVPEGNKRVAASSGGR